MNANNPAGINPVVNNNLNWIPKSGMWATNCGSKDIPIPKESDKANIKRFLWLISDWEINLIPAAVINPNIMIAAPPRTDSGIAAIIPPSFGNKPDKIKITPATVPTCLLIIPVKATSPAFCEYEVFGIALKIDAKVVPSPSAIIPPDNSLSVASLSAPPIVVALYHQ